MSEMVKVRGMGGGDVGDLLNFYFFILLFIEESKVQCFVGGVYVAIYKMSVSY